MNNELPKSGDCAADSQQHLVAPETTPSPRLDPAERPVAADDGGWQEFTRELEKTDGLVIVATKQGKVTWAECSWGSWHSCGEDLSYSDDWITHWRPFPRHPTTSERIEEEKPNGKCHFCGDEFVAEPGDNICDTCWYHMKKAHGEKAPPKPEPVTPA